jgi:hypothetical protein
MTLRYIVWIEQPDGVTAGGVEDDFEKPLAKDSTVEHGGVQCLVTDVDDTQDPPHVWLKPRPVL